MTAVEVTAVEVTAVEVTAVEVTAADNSDTEEGSITEGGSEKKEGPEEEESEEESGMEGLFTVTSMADISHFAPGSAIVRNDFAFDGLRVFIPKNFFNKNVLPKNHNEIFGCVHCP